MSPEQKSGFNEAIHLVPVWNMTDKIIYDYLMSFSSPIVKIRSTYNSKRPNGENHCISECSYPSRLALCEGAIVMLLKNFIVELNLMNGSVGIVRKIVYKDKTGPYNSNNNLPEYVIVEFKNVNIPENNKPFSNFPNNWIPIPMVTEFCEKKCCSVKTIPLRVCIALTIHKSQGMTIGPKENFEKIVIHLPNKALGHRSTAGLELVALSRVTSIENIAIGNDHNSLFRADLKNIGKNKTNEKIKEFHKLLFSMESISQISTINEITQLDLNTDCDKTFDGGCDFLLSWFTNIESSYLN